MLNKIAEFLDLDIITVGSAVIIDEFRHKYCDSWIYINDKLAYINQLSKNGRELLITYVNTYAPIIIIEPVEFKRYTPPTGLYCNDKLGIIYLSRLSTRQWVKGFKMGVTYDYKMLGNKRIVDVVAFLNDKATRYNRETIKHINDFYIHWKKVGTYNGDHDKLFITDKHFIKEVEELWPQYRLTLDAVPQQKHMEERLKLDF